jgi:hypothetical protein
MLGEAIAVQSNMNTFSQLISDSQIDAHVIVISSGPPTPVGCSTPNDPTLCAIETLVTGIGSFIGSNGVCIDPPLGLQGACPDNDDTNPANGYWHVFQEVGSTNALSIIQSTFPQWQANLRPDAAKTFVVVTDDDNNPPPNEAEFTTWVNGQPEFASALWRFSGVFCATDGGNCSAAGTTYNNLVTQTGGIAGNLSNFSDQTIDAEFATVFDSLAEAVIADAVPVECEWVIPPPPDGETLDKNKVNVKFTDSAGTTQTIYGVGSDECPPASDFLAWYYDDPINPQRVIACADTCPVLQADDNARIDVQFGCATEPPPIR